MSSIFENPMMKSMAIKMAKKIFAENGCTLIAIAPGEGGELSVTEFREPVSIVATAKLNEMIQKINDLNDLLKQYENGQ